MKIAVVYWSGTGNTEAMAELVAEGAKGKGADVKLITADHFGAAQVADYDAFAFGCPSMGDEELEETTFAPMWEDVKGELSGKTVALFGSYGWGDGQWMEDWEEDLNDIGANAACDSVICNNAPDDAGEAACLALGEALC